MEPIRVTRPRRACVPAHEYVVRDGRMLVAVVKDRDELASTITADLYRNLEDLGTGAVMERGVVLAV